MPIPGKIAEESISRLANVISLVSKRFHPDHHNHYSTLLILPKNQATKPTLYTLPSIMWIPARQQQEINEHASRNEVRLTTAKFGMNFNYWNTV